jgi:hypothetical protein
VKSLTRPGNYGRNKFRIVVSWRVCLSQSKVVHNNKDNSLLCYGIYYSREKSYNTGSRDIYKYKTFHRRK